MWSKAPPNSSGIATQVGLSALKILIAWTFFVGRPFGGGGAGFLQCCCKQLKLSSFCSTGLPPWLLEMWQLGWICFAIDSSMPTRLRYRDTLRVLLDHLSGVHHMFCQGIHVPVKDYQCWWWIHLSGKHSTWGNWHIHWSSQWSIGVCIGCWVCLWWIAMGRYHALDGQDKWYQRVLCNPFHACFGWSYTTQLFLVWKRCLVGLHELSHSLNWGSRRCETSYKALLVSSPQVKPFGSPDSFWKSK